MALVYCPECKTKVSEKAVSCPFCGYSNHRKKLPIMAYKKIQRELCRSNIILELESDQVFPISRLQINNLEIIFCRAENLSRVAPSFFEVVKAALPKTIKVAETNQAIQKLIDSGVYRFIVDKNGEILPSIYGEKGVVAQVRLKDVKLTPDLSHSIIDLQTQIALAHIIGEIHDVQKAIVKIHNELQDDRLALAESAWQQLQQAIHIDDSRVREEKLLNILSSATDAKCILFRAFASEKKFFDERKDKGWYSKLIDREAQNHGEERSDEIFNSLLAIIQTVQVETTTYCLLGEQNAAYLSLKQFSDFIKVNSLDNRDTLLMMDSYGRLSNSSVIENFIDIQRKMELLPLDERQTQPLYNTISVKRERDNE